MAFRYHAIDASGQTQVDTIAAASEREAAELLRDRGMFVTQLEPAPEGEGTREGFGEADPAKRARLRDVVLFTQQMSMLVRAGAQVVQALEAVEGQTDRPAWRDVVHAVRLEVEHGRTLSESLAEFPQAFSGIYTSMIAAGEASGDMGLAFDRLTTLTRQQQEIRNRVIGAMTYPLVLVVLCTGVVVALFSFVLPRFAEMFETLEVDLPVTTAVMIDASDWARAHWQVTIGTVVGSILGAFALLRTDAGRSFISAASVRVPLFGVLVRNIIFARICRIWGQLLSSKVGLLDAVALTQTTTNNQDFRSLLAEIAQAITDGNSIGPPLKRSWLVSRTFTAAIVTGEDSGRLADSLLFVAVCLEEDNTQALASLARTIEPILLTVMGVLVGAVAISLFLPMFDMATIAGR